MINFESVPFRVHGWTILLLPKEASAELPSRGLVLVEGSINGHKFKTPLEPDGRFSHWLRVDEDLQKAAGVKAGGTVEVEIEVSKDWPEPEIPADLKKALEKHPEAKKVWDSTTPLARWDWIRSIRSTNSAETRERRIETACSKLTAGKPRQCCFNRNICSEPHVSKNWMLAEPAA